jgi:hypothetical protein
MSFIATRGAFSARGFGMMNKLSTNSKTYATWDPANVGSNIALSGGNLIATSRGVGAAGAVRSTIGHTTGKYYFEITITTGITSSRVGTEQATESLTVNVGSGAGAWAYQESNGDQIHSGTSSTYGATYTTGDIIGVALDLDTPALTFYKNNTSQGSIPGFTVGATTFAAVGASSVGAVFTANFGATAFTYTPPAGYNAGLY